MLKPQSTLVCLPSFGHKVTRITCKLQPRAIGISNSCNVHYRVCKEKQFRNFCVPLFTSPSKIHRVVANTGKLQFFTWVDPMNSLCMMMQLGGPGDLDLDLDLCLSEHGHSNHILQDITQTNWNSHQVYTWVVNNKCWLDSVHILGALN